MPPSDGQPNAWETALRPCLDADEVQVVGALSERVAGVLALATAARSVWLHPDTLTHIVARRSAAPGDAAFVLDHLPASVLRPHWAAPEHDPRRVRLIHTVARWERHVHLAIKCVAARDAATGHDELWVSTAYPLGARSLTRVLRSGRFVRVETGA